MAPKIKITSERIHEAIGSAFDQAQQSFANHRKNCVTLHKLHEEAASVTKPAKDGSMTKLVGERIFSDAFVDMINRVLVVKRGPPAADRIVRFIGSYIKFLNDRVSLEREKKIKEPSSSAAVQDVDEDTFSSRFIARLLKWLLRGFVARNKTTRHRSVAIVAQMIAHIGEVDEDLYDLLRRALLDRICDKESLIRAHATIGLSKLIGTEDADDVKSGKRTISDELLDVVSYDEAPEVRRAALLNIPLLPTTLDVVLQRARDTDILTRKLVYSTVLKMKLEHPRHLTIAQREQIIKDGLGDREPTVRVACGNLVASWFDLVLLEHDSEDMAWQGDDGGVMKCFVKFLALFDVVGEGEVIAADAMLSILVTRPSLTEAFMFSESYWKELTPESAVMARVFLEHCTSLGSEARLENASLPVMTDFAFHIQEEYNTLIGILREAESALILNASTVFESDDGDQREEEMAKQEVIISQLLQMALKLDYMDEIGRRKLFVVVRDMIAHPELPPGLINPGLDVLKAISPTERDLIRVIVEVIIDLREIEQDATDHRSDLNDESLANVSQTTLYKDKSSMRRIKSRESMTAEERAEADVTDLRCLTLCIAVLERIDGSFEDNSTLEGVLTDLIIPSMKRKELPLREKGLMSLGLCCLIAKNMAMNSIQLFLNQVQSSPCGLKLQILHVVFDLLITYEQEFFKKSDEIAEKIINFMLQTLETEDSPEIQAIICVGLAKLLLSGAITDSRVLIALVLSYVSPATANNQELRQCLSYFLPVYSYSSPANQKRMQSIFITAFELFKTIQETVAEDQETISTYQFGLHIVDWTNPQKRVRVHAAEPRDDTHAELAMDILAALYDSERTDDDQKLLCQLLGQLRLSSDLDERSIHKLNLLIQNHEEQCPFADESTSKIFDRFKIQFTETYRRSLYIEPGKYLDEEFIELYEFIGVDPPKPKDVMPPGLSTSSRRRSIALSIAKGTASLAGNSELQSVTPCSKKVISANSVKGKPSSGGNAITRRQSKVTEDQELNTNGTPEKRGLKRRRVSITPTPAGCGRKRGRTKVSTMDPHLRESRSRNTSSKPITRNSRHR